MDKIEIPLVEVEELKTGRGGGKRGGGAKYGKYESALEGLVGWVEEKIAASADGTIRVKVADLVKSAGMTPRHNTSIYWGTKFAMWKHGYVVSMGKTKAGEAVLIFRARKKGDKLPDSLAKHLGEAGEGGGGEKDEGEEKEEE